MEMKKWMINRAVGMYVNAREDLIEVILTEGWANDVMRKLYDKGLPEDEIRRIMKEGGIEI